MERGNVCRNIEKERTAWPHRPGLAMPGLREAFFGRVFFENCSVLFGVDSEMFSGVVFRRVFCVFFWHLSSSLKCSVRTCHTDSWPQYEGVMKLLVELLGGFWTLFKWLAPLLAWFFLFDHI